MAESEKKMRRFVVRLLEDPESGTLTQRIVRQKFAAHVGVDEDNLSSKTRKKLKEIVLELMMPATNSHAFPDTQGKKQISEQMEAVEPFRSSDPSKPTSMKRHNQKTTTAADCDSGDSDVNSSRLQKKKKPRIDFSDSGMDSENETTNKPSDRSEPMCNGASEDSSEDSKEETDLAAKTTDAIATLDKAMKQMADETPQSDESRNSNDAVPLRSIEGEHIPVTSPSKVGRLNLRKVAYYVAATGGQTLNDCKTTGKSGRYVCAEDSNGHAKTSCKISTVNRQRISNSTTPNQSDSDDEEAFNREQLGSLDGDSDSDFDSKETGRHSTKKQRHMPGTTKSKRPTWSEDDAATSRRPVTQSSDKHGSTKRTTLLKSVRKTDSSSETSDTDDDDDQQSEASDGTPRGDDIKQISPHSTEKTNEDSNSSGSDFKEARKPVSRKQPTKPLASPLKQPKLHTDGTKGRKRQKGQPAKATGNSEDSKTVQHLKRMIAAAGMRKPYVRLLADCKSEKAKVGVLKGILEDAGIEGRPTLEKCKKLKQQREQAAELADLDPSNIITSTCGTTRSARQKLCDKSRKTHNSSTSQEKMNSRFSLIISSGDESDSD